MHPLARGPRASPTRNGKAFLNPVGEGLAPPAVLRKRSSFRRRGGTLGRPGFQFLLTFLQPCRGGPRGRLSGWLLPNLDKGAPWAFRRRCAGYDGTLIRPLWGHLPPCRGKALWAGLGPAPTADMGATALFLYGPVPDRPARIRTGNVGWATPGAGAEPHQS